MEQSLPSSYICDRIAPKAKSEASFSKKNGLEKSRWIGIGVVVKAALRA